MYFCTPCIFLAFFTYNEYIYETNLSNEEKKIIKIADKICAYIKCSEENSLGNKDFKQIMNSLFYEIKEFGSVEADYFLENCFNSFFLSLEELKK